MEKANIKETLNGNNNEKYITPYLLHKKLSDYTPLNVSGKASKNLYPSGLTQVFSAPLIKLTKGTYTITEIDTTSGNWYFGAYKNGSVLSSGVSFSVAFNWSSTTEVWYRVDETLKGFTFTLNQDCEVQIGRLNATGTQKVQLEKGSTATEYEKYFEPSISIKDSKGDYHEVPYMTGKVSKNLFNAYKYSENKTHTGNVSKYSIINPNEIEISYISGWSRLVLTVTGLEPNTAYTISAYLNKSNYNTSVASGFYDGSEYKDSGFTKGSGNVYLTFTSSSTGTFDMWFYGNWSGTNYSGSIVYENIQIEKGSTKTSYEEPFEPTLSIRNSNGIFQEVLNVNEKVGYKDYYIEGNTAMDITFNTGEVAIVTTTYKSGAWKPMVLLVCALGSSLQVNVLGTASDLFSYTTNGLTLSTRNNYDGSNYTTVMIINK